MMEPKVALTTAPTAKLLWAEMLQIPRGKKKNILQEGHSAKQTNVPVCFDPIKNKPGDPHTNIIRQGYDGADGYGKLDVRAGKAVFFVNVSNNHGDNHQRKEV